MQECRISYHTASKGNERLNAADASWRAPVAAPHRGQVSLYQLNAMTACERHTPTKQFNKIERLWQKNVQGRTSCSAPQRARVVVPAGCQHATVGADARLHLKTVVTVIVPAIAQRELQYDEV